MHEAPQFQRELAERWEEFVGCAERTLSLRAFFTTYVLAPDYRIAIDLGAGTGCEARWMASLFHRFIANEVDETFRGDLERLRQDIAANFEITTFNWLDLNGSKLQSIDLAFLIGNSLCLLNVKEDIAAALASIRNILRSGARFVVDQRNFDYMLDERREILSGDFRYSGHVMYCGTTVVGRPTAISDDAIDFGYFDRATNRCIGSLTFLPMRLQELKQMLVASGFSIEFVHSDLRPKYDARADFYSVVCRAA